MVIAGFYRPWTLHMKDNSKYNNNNNDICRTQKHICDGNGNNNNNNNNNKPNIFIYINKSYR